MSKASKRQTSSRSRATVEQIIVLAGFIASVLAKILSFDQAQYWLTNKGLLKQKLFQAFGTVEPLAELRQEWQSFYKDHFDIEVDFATITIPEKPLEGSWRLIFIAKSLTMNQVLAAMRTQFKAWTSYADDDINKAVTKNVRTATHSYAIWVRDSIEPDEQYLGQSTEQADPNSTVGMTLLERMILELKYFKETGQHLDIKGGTLCTGSRTTNGHVPRVRWHPGGQWVGVGYCDVSGSGSSGGLREVVS